MYEMIVCLYHLNFFGLGSREAGKLNYVRERERERESATNEISFVASPLKGEEERASWASPSASVPQAKSNLQRTFKPQLVKTSMSLPFECRDRYGKLIQRLS